MGDPLTSGPKIRHETTMNSVFVGGTYIELGVRNDQEKGKYGTVDCPTGWTCRQHGKDGIGMLSNYFGFTDDRPKWADIDYFMPGTPEERFWVGYKDPANVEHE